METPTKLESSAVRLVDAVRLIELLFEPECRPSIRSIRNWSGSGIIPHVRVGHLIYFDPVAVKAALAKQTISAKKENT